MEEVTRVGKYLVAHASLLDILFSVFANGCRIEYASFNHWKLLRNSHCVGVVTATRIDYQFK